MALTQPELKSLAQALCAMIEAVERGITPARLRDEMAAAGIPSRTAETWIEVATALQESPHAEPAPVLNPGYRKGAAMKPVAWSDCLWQPPA